ncbi:hypothetical protein BLNAU_9568 [Blattamonas nauphoetae]|uniref:Uncharacterized protein n=1 Tax=Blattamonas nauphoetae TaxID=2049346 RepID=A0ABQ9XVL3_9EUKA|nr:hypothetical protein BLNAU_9568 [Blattamonas nauphoetae]
MLPQKSQKTPEDPIVIDSDNDVGSILLDVDPVDTLQTLVRDIFSDSQDLSIKSFKKLRQLLSENETLIDILVTYEDIKNLSTLLTESQAQTSIVFFSFYGNCNTLIKSGLCLAILEKATPSSITKQSALFYLHIWKILESFTEYATLSLDPAINILLPSIVTNTISILLTIPQSSVKTRGASPLTKPQRSDLYRSFINFTMHETISCMVYGIKTDLFQVIESKYDDLVVINEEISPTKMPELQELIGSTFECVTLPVCIF